MASTPQSLTGIDLAEAAELAAQLRVDSVRSSTSAGSGHPTSSMSAADLLAAYARPDDIHARVIDLYSVKPIDTETLVAAAAVTSGRLIVTEDHHPEGGLGSAVTDALLEAGPQKLWVTRLAVRHMPGSGTGDELLAAAGVDAQHIESAARDLLNAT
jgi:transketolase